MEPNFQGIILGSDPAKKRKRSTEPEHTPTASKKSPSSEFLCEDCTNLDLAKALQVKDQDGGVEFDPSRWGYFNTWAVDVGHRYRVTRTTNCNLCRMLFKSRVEEEDPALDGDVDWIRAVSFLHFSRLVQLGSKFWHSWDFPVLMLFSNKNYDLKKNYKRIMNLIQVSGCAALQQRNQKQAVPLSLKVIPPRFDLGTFRKWFDYCNKNHGLLCRSTKTELCGTRLIDCEGQSIVEHGPGMPYVALSYVWGQPTAQRQVTSGKQLPTQLSLVIRDAMAVTQAMGFRYLWVDRYCIDQNSPTVVHQQIGQMGAIYGNAEVTIIAAAGQDENYGLSGVGINRPETQRVAQNGEVAVVWATGDPQAVIKSSHWSTRGWTFQEALLSRRRLVFTEEQAYFECSAMNIFESLDIPLDSLHTKDRSKSYEDLRGGIFGRNRTAEFGRFILQKQGKGEIFSQYLSNVEEYSARKLTFAKDSLDAFQGIAQQFWHRRHAVHNIWGLPYPTLPADRESGFAYSLSWRHIISCWDFSQSPHRRPQFPSWSWAGWEGEIQYQMPWSKHNLWSNKLFETISFENEMGSSTTLEMIVPNIDETCDFPVMRLTAAVFPSKLISFNCKADSDKHWQIGKYKADLALSYGSVSESQFAQDIHDSHIWQCVCIGGSGGGVSVMILKIHDSSGLWERAGLLIIDCYSHNIERMIQPWEYKLFRVR